MGRFEELIGDDTYDAEPYDIGPYYDRPKFQGIPEDIKREAIRRVTPEAEGKSVGGFAKNLVSDVGDVAGGFAALMGYPIFHPINTAKAVGGAVKSAIEDPGAAVKKVGEVLTEPYVPNEGETFLQHLGQRAYEHPFSTAADAAFVLGGPLSIAGKAAEAAGAARTAAALTGLAANLDPIEAARKAGVAIMRSAAPDALAAMRTSSALADFGAEETARLRFHKQEADRLMNGPGGVLADLNHAERAVFFPYAEGRFYMDNGQWGEFTHQGMFEPRPDMPIRQEALDAAVQKYIPVQEKLDQIAGLDKDTVVKAKLEDWTREKAKAPDFDPMDPGFHSELDGQRQAFEQEWEDMKLTRRTVSMRTALDVAKEQKWTAEVQRAKAANHLATTAEAETLVPKPVPTTPQEALALMGPGGGVIFPHNMDVFTREQSSLGNLLQKLREASIYKENTGALFRSGALQHLNPAEAVIRTYTALHAGASFPKVAQDMAEQLVGEGLAERVGKGFRPALDPRLQQGTHQLLDPHLLWSETLGEGELKRLTGRLMEVADDPEAQKLLMNELGDRLDKGTRDTLDSFLKGERPMYVIPTGAGHSLKAWRASFEPATNPFAIMSDKIADRWNFWNLNTRTTRLTNNIIGNMVFTTLQGVHPFSRDGIGALVDFGKALGSKLGLTDSEEAAKLAKVFELPGVGQSGLTGASDALEGAGRYGEQLMQSANPLARGLGRFGAYAQRLNATAEDLFRGASAIYSLKKNSGAWAKEFMGSAAAGLDTAEEINRLRSLGGGAVDDQIMKRMVGDVNKFLNNYDRSTALQRRLVRRLFPYHKFYSHAISLFFHQPFEQPIKNTLMRRLGAAALQDTKDTLKSWGYDWDSMVPDNMRDSIPMRFTTGPDGSPLALLVNTKGPNPFSLLSGTDPGAENLSALHPVIKVAVEMATGINLFKGEKYRGAFSSDAGREVDPLTGETREKFVRPNVVEDFLQQFWPYQTVRELVANGRIPTDTATLVDMLSNSPTAWQVDDQGFPRRRPLPLGRSGILLRSITGGAQALQYPTKNQMDTEKGIVSGQLSDLAQRHPEMFDRIWQEIAKIAEEKATSDEDGLPFVLPRVR